MIRRPITLALLIALSLPSPAFALRAPNAGQEESAAHHALEDTLTSPLAGGLEERPVAVPITQVYAEQHKEALAAIDRSDRYWREKRGTWAPERFPMTHRPWTGTELKDVFTLSFAVEDSRGVPVAYIYATNGHDDYPVTRSHPGVFIYRLSVHRDFQGRGLGTVLLHAASRAAKAQRIGPWVTLETADYNTDAMTFYKSLGFENVGTGYDKAQDVTFVQYAMPIDTLIERAEAKLRRHLGGGLEEGSLAVRQLTSAIRAQLIVRGFTVEQPKEWAFQADGDRRRKPRKPRTSWRSTFTVGDQAGQRLTLFVHSDLDGRGLSVAINDPIRKDDSDLRRLANAIGPVVRRTLEGYGGRWADPLQGEWKHGYYLPNLDRAVVQQRQALNVLMAPAVQSLRELQGPPRVSIGLAQNLIISDRDTGGPLAASWFDPLRRLGYPVVVTIAEVADERSAVLLKMRGDGDEVLYLTTATVAEPKVPVVSLVGLNGESLSSEIAPAVITGILAAWYQQGRPLSMVFDVSPYLGLTELTPKIIRQVITEQYV